MKYSGDAKTIDQLLSEIILTIINDSRSINDTEAPQYFENPDPDPNLTNNNTSQAPVNNNKNWNYNSPKAGNRCNLNKTGKEARAGTKARTRTRIKHDKYPKFYPREDEFPITSGFFNCPIEVTAVCGILSKEKIMQQHDYALEIAVVELTFNILKIFLPDAAHEILSSSPCYVDIFNNVKSFLEDYFISDNINFQECRKIARALKVIEDLLDCLLKKK